MPEVASVPTRLPNLPQSQAALQIHGGCEEAVAAMEIAQPVPSELKTESTRPGPMLGIVTRNRLSGALVVDKKSGETLGVLPESLIRKFSLGHLDIIRITSRAPDGRMEFVVEERTGRVNPDRGELPHCIVSKRGDALIIEQVLIGGSKLQLNVPGLIRITGRSRKKFTGT